MMYGKSLDQGSELGVASYAHEMFTEGAGA